MDNCPKCKTSWIGGEIPKAIVYHYNVTHWKREIGIDGGFLGIYDGIVAIKCLDCKEEFPKDDSSWAKLLFDQYKKKDQHSTGPQQNSASNRDKATTRLLMMMERPGFAQKSAWSV